MPRTLPTVSEPGLTPNVDLVGAAGIGARAQASLFSEIAQSAAQLRSQLQPILDQQAEERANRDVEQAFAQRPEGDNTLPDLDLRRAWTQQDQVYNNAVTAGALARAGVDMEAEATRLRELFPYDPAGFENAYSQFVSGYVENAPINIGAQIELSMMQTFSREQARIAERTRVAAINEQEEALTLRMAHLDEQMRSGIENDGIGFVDSEAGGDIARQYADIVNILVDNPAFGHSAEWGADQLDTFGTRAREGVLTEAVRNIYDSGGPVAALEFIDEQVRSLDVSPEEAISIRSRLTGELQTLQTIDSSRRAEQNRQDELSRERLEDLGNDWFARAIEARTAGQPLPEEMIRELPDLVRVGAVSQSEAQQWTQAAGGSITENDELAISLHNMARDGTPAERLRELMNPHVGRDLTTETYLGVLSATERYSDERFSAGRDVITAAFGQAAFDFAFDNSQAVLEQTAISELDAWLEANPEANRFDARRQATLIAIRLGREVGSPPPPRGGAPDVTATQETFENWYNDGLDYVIRQDDAGLWASDGAREEYSNRLENYRQWWAFQNGLSQMERSLNNAN